MKENHELKSSALDQLEGNWGIAIAITLIAWLLTSAFTGNGSRESAEYIWENGRWIPNSTFTSLASLVALLLSGPLEYGKSAFYLSVANKQEGSFSDFMSGFEHYGKTLLLHILQVIFIVLWSLLLIIPGIIAAFSYSMSYYILNDNPELSAMEAIALSKEMMSGHKLDLFVLYLSFFGWFILGLFTLGLGFLYLAPYSNATIANFYQALKAEI